MISVFDLFFWSCFAVQMARAADLMEAFGAEQGVKFKAQEGSES